MKNSSITESVQTIEHEVFQILRASLFTGELVDLTNWKDIFAELKVHSVAALPYDYLQKHLIPDYSSWLQYCSIQQGQWIRIMYAQQQLLKLLTENDIPCVILKGSAAGMAYPNPSLRSMGDIDFLVKRSDFEKTALLMEKNGYRLTHEKDITCHHYGYTKDGIRFELHRRLHGIMDSDENFLSVFDKGIENRAEKKINDFSFSVLPVDLNGIVLILHIEQHLREGLGLRQIIDWMMYVDQLPENVWNESVFPKIAEIGMGKLALTVTAMCQKYLGLRTIVPDTDNYPCDKLMSYIMKMGNFGRKAGVSGKAATFAFYSTDTTHFFGRLQSGGLAQWKAAQKHRILRPFAWIYQSFRLLRILFAKRIKPRELLEQKKQGLEQRELIEELGLKVNKQ